ncbi:hypothetical protein E2C01_027558 [Portunus trituberculatus]|uniref:Uncharacterized protein n=1 Tax=Portunus trituberculatus TaxID=210409 RepID=A0A5B7ELM1_PORTR|nr:hypothetical protein [Portunus trituberculatus]
MRQREGIRLGDFMSSPGESQEGGPGQGQGGRQQGERRGGGGRGHRGGNKNRSHFGNPDHNYGTDTKVPEEIGGEIPEETHQEIDSGLKTESPVECVDAESLEEGEVYCEASTEEVEEGELLVGDSTGMEEVPRASTPTPAAEDDVVKPGAAEEDREVRREDEEEDESLKCSEADGKTVSEGDTKEEGTQPIQETDGGEKEVAEEKEEEKETYQDCKEIETSKEAQIDRNEECNVEKEDEEEEEEKEKEKEEKEEEEESKTKNTEEEAEMKSKNNTGQENIQEEIQTLEKSDEKSK